MWLTCCVEIHTNDPIEFHMHIDVTLISGCWIKVCTLLINMICLCNYYILFCHLPWSYAKRSTPYNPQAVPPIPNRIKILVISECIVLLSVIITYVWIWSIPGDLCPLSFPIAISISKTLGSFFTLTFIKNVQTNHHANRNTKDYFHRNSS
jgi:hypothetical protein